MILESLKPEVDTIIGNTQKTVNERLLEVCKLLETQLYCLQHHGKSRNSGTYFCKW